MTHASPADPPPGCWRQNSSTAFPQRYSLRQCPIDKGQAYVFLAKNISVPETLRDRPDFGPAIPVPGYEKSEARSMPFNENHEKSIS
jgi:hypothetical protein